MVFTVYTLVWKEYGDTRIKYKSKLKIHTKEYTKKICTGKRKGKRENLKKRN